MQHSREDHDDACYRPPNCPQAQMTTVDRWIVSLGTKMLHLRSRPSERKNIEYRRRITPSSPSTTMRPSAFMPSANVHNWRCSRPLRSGHSQTMLSSFMCGNPGSGVAPWKHVHGLATIVRHYETPHTVPATGAADDLWDDQDSVSGAGNHCDHIVLGLHVSRASSYWCARHRNRVVSPQLLMDVRYDRAMTTLV